MIPIGQVWMPLLFLILSEGLQTTARTSDPSLNGPQMVCTLKHPGVVAMLPGKTTTFKRAQGMTSMLGLLPGHQ